MSVSSVSVLKDTFLSRNNSFAKMCDMVTI